LQIKDPSKDLIQGTVPVLYCVMRLKLLYSIEAWIESSDVQYGNVAGTASVQYNGEVKNGAPPSLPQPRGQPIQGLSLLCAYKPTVTS
jgi:hypothetical protein